MQFPKSIPLTKEERKARRKVVRKEKQLTFVKKISRKQYIKKLDDIVSKIIRFRDKKCVVCGSTSKLTNGHVFSRRHYMARWDVSVDGNCHCQCWGCNYLHTHDQYPYFAWYIDSFGEEKFHALRKRTKTQVADWKDYELAELFEKLKKHAHDMGL